MTTEGGGGPKLPEKGGPDLPSWRRVGDFLRSIMGLESSVASLKKQVSDLERRVDDLQRVGDRQAGQLKVLTEFVRGALDDRMQGRIRRALDEHGRTKDRDG